MSAFVCKLCAASLPAEEEVVTRWHTRTCRTCWGLRVSRDGRRYEGISEDVCRQCRKNPVRIEVLSSGKKKRSWCLDCKRAHTNARRVAYRHLDPQEKLRANARSAANVALRRGKLTRQACQDCGTPAAEMHHEDYAKPLEVIWVCTPCHRRRHRDETLIPRGTTRERETE